MQKKKSVHSIPRLSKRAKTDSSTGTSVVKPTEQVAAVGDLALTADQPVIEVATDVGPVDGVGRTNSASDLVDLTDKFPTTKKKKETIFNGIFTGSTGSIEDGSTKFLKAEGEVVSTAIFEDSAGRLSWTLTGDFGLR